MADKMQWFCFAIASLIGLALGRTILNNGLLLIGAWVLTLPFWWFYVKEVMIPEIEMIKKTNS